jgi:hypothetical protein
MVRTRKQFIDEIRASMYRPKKTKDSEFEKKLKEAARALGRIYIPPPEPEPAPRPVYRPQPAPMPAVAPAPRAAVPASVPKIAATPVRQPAPKPGQQTQAQPASVPNIPVTDKGIPAIPFVEPEQTTEKTETVEDKVAAVPKRLQSYIEPKWIDHNYKNPTLYDFCSYIRLPIADFGRIEGEEKTAIVGGMCVVNGTHFAFEGKSGTCKTVLMDKVLYLIPPDMIATMYMGSAQSLQYEGDKINGKKLLYLPEINNMIPQNAGKKDAPIEKSLKLLGEGKPAEFTVVVGGKPKKLVIEPITACYTRAFENAYGVRPELRRRFIVAETHSDAQQIYNYHVGSNNDRHTLFTDNSSQKKLLSRMKQHFTNLMNLEGVETFDPFSDHLINVIPRTEKSKCYLQQYYAILDASAKFHIADRKKIKLTKKVDGMDVEKLVVFLNLEDHYIAHKVFYEPFVESLRKYQNDGFIEEIDRMPTEIDWKAYLKCGLGQMQQNNQIRMLLHNHSDFVDNWYSDQITGSAVYTVDYMTGSKEKITDL